MKKIILPLLIIIILAIISPDVFASSLNVSKNASFSSSDLNFGGGEKIYVKVDSDGSGSSQKVLNIRDNQYNLIGNYDLAKSGNQFTASFNAPNNQGYFSLEAVIEGDGASSKSVKTIRVGGSGSANVKVNVNSNVKGTKSTYMTNGTSGADRTNGERMEEGSERANSVSPTPEVFTGDDNSAGTEKQKERFWLFTFFGNIFSFFWPFK